MPCAFAGGMPYYVYREAGTLPTLNTSTMDNHNYWLDLFESFERHQTELEARDSLMVLNRDIQPKWEIQAFLNNELQWADPAYDDDELQSLKNAATEAGFTYTVEPVK
jgi:hypothetical protein